jgi:hypothetical protein
LKPSENGRGVKFFQRLEVHYSSAKVLLLSLLLLVGLGYAFKIQIKNLFYSSKVHACLEKNHVDACEFVCQYGNVSACEHYRDKILSRQCFESKNQFSCLQLCHDFNNKTACNIEAKETE